jgi:hypothetical protein
MYEPNRNTALVRDLGEIETEYSTGRPFLDLMAWFMMLIDCDNFVKFNGPKPSSAQSISLPISRYE